MKSIYFDELKNENDIAVKFGDSHTREFDTWIRKEDCQWYRWNHGYRVFVPDSFEMRICLA